jgi:DNA-binding CsgD family transcriptional regulator
MAETPAEDRGMSPARDRALPYAPLPGSRIETPTFVERKPRHKLPVSPERCANVLGTLQEIGRASADMDGCSRLLECVAEELEAEQGVLILCNPLTEKLEFVVHHQDAAFPKLYGDYFWELDPTGLPDYIKGKVSLPASSPALAVFDIMDVVDYESLLSSEFYNDFWRSGGIHYDLVAFMSATPLARGALCLHRARERRPFSPEEVAIMDMIAPFVGNHLEKMVSASVLSVLQTAEQKAVIVCDSHGRVLYCNGMARDLCLSLTQGESGSRLTEELAPDAGLASFVGYALSSPDTLAERCNVGVQSREVTLDQGTLGRLITLEPRGGRSKRWDEPLKERFALTDREIEVLDRLIAGGSNREISQALFIAECTVKKHIQSISGKVGARTRTSIAHAVRKELGLTP